MKRQRQLALRLSTPKATEMLWDRFPNFCRQQLIQFYTTLIVTAARTEADSTTTKEKTNEHADA